MSDDRAHIFADHTSPNTTPNTAATLAAHPKPRTTLCSRRLGVHMLFFSGGRIRIFSGSCSQKKRKKCFWRKKEMQLVLAGLTTRKDLNGTCVTLVAPSKHVSGDRIAVRLCDGKHISVPYTSVDASQLELQQCAICACPCFPGYTSRTSCDHLFHTSCIQKWRSTPDGNMEAPGTRCPICRAYVGQSSRTSWSKMPAMHLVVMALGSIFQIHARQQGLSEPSAEEELAFVMQCTRSALANGQADYRPIEVATRALEIDPSSSEKQRDVLDQLKASLIMHVFHDESVKPTYTAAIRSWLTTLTME